MKHIFSSVKLDKGDCDKEKPTEPPEEPPSNATEEEEQPPQEYSYEGV